MSRELIYTSAPRGVKPGSQGFCTVAYTHGMPANLIQQLESLSGYRHIFSPQDSKASLNPVVLSHLVLTVAGRRCHVLSRICDAGLDYTQRTNKFARHIVLDAAEVPSAGPAWLLAQPGFVQNKWVGEPQILTTGPVVPSGESKPVRMPRLAAAYWRCGVGGRACRNGSRTYEPASGARVSAGNGHVAVVRRELGPGACGTPLARLV